MSSYIYIVRSLYFNMKSVHITVRALHPFVRNQNFLVPYDACIDVNDGCIGDVLCSSLVDYNSYIKYLADARW